MGEDLGKRPTDYVVVPQALFDVPWLRENRGFTRRDAWLWLLLNVSPRETRVRRRHGNVKLKRGEGAWSIRELAAQWKWGASGVMRFLQELAAEGLIVIGKSSGPSYVVTTITVTGYDDFAVVRRRRYTSAGAELSPQAVDAKLELTEQRRLEFNRNRARLTLALIDAGTPYICSHPECRETVNLTLDHRVAISRGGSDDLSNLQFMCQVHNSAKGDR